MSVKQKVAGTCIAATLAMPVTAHFEGLRVRAYLDPVGIATICYGETENVALGQVRTKQECDEMLAMRLGYYAYQVDRLVAPEIHPRTQAALTSFVYNVGVGAFERSTLLRKLNGGDIKGACNQLPRWVYAGGRKFTGLVKRREAERELCLEGLQLSSSVTGNLS